VRWVRYCRCYGGDDFYKKKRQGRKRGGSKEKETAVWNRGGEDRLRRVWRVVEMEIKKRAGYLVGRKGSRTEKGLSVTGGEKKVYWGIGWR